MEAGGATTPLRVIVTVVYPGVALTKEKKKDLRVPVTYLREGILFCNSSNGPGNVSCLCYPIGQTPRRSGWVVLCVLSVMPQDRFNRITLNSSDALTNLSVNNKM